MLIVFKVLTYEKVPTKSRGINCSLCPLMRKEVLNWLKLHLDYFS